MPSGLAGRTPCTDRPYVRLQTLQTFTPPNLALLGDVHVRILMEQFMLMHGARAVIARSQRSGWIERLLPRRPYSVVVAALANKLAQFNLSVFGPDEVESGRVAAARRTTTMNENKTPGNRFEGESMQGL